MNCGVSGKLHLDNIYDIKHPTDTVQLLISNNTYTPINVISSDLNHESAKPVVNICLESIKLTQTHYASKY